MLTTGVRARRALCRLARPLPRPGPRCSSVGRRPAGHARVAVGRAGGDALEQREHRAHLGHVVERGDEVHLGRAGVGEAHVDARRRRACGSGPARRSRRLHAHGRRRRLPDGLQHDAVPLGQLDQCRELIAVGIGRRGRTSTGCRGTRPGPPCRRPACRGSPDRPPRAPSRRRRAAATWRRPAGDARARDQRLQQHVARAQLRAVATGRRVQARLGDRGRRAHAAGHAAAVELALGAEGDHRALGSSRYRCLSGACFSLSAVARSGAASEVMAASCRPSRAASRGSRSTSPVVRPRRPSVAGGRSRGPAGAHRPEPLSVLRLLGVPLFLWLLLGGRGAPRRTSGRSSCSPSAGSATGPTASWPACSTSTAGWASCSTPRSTASTSSRRCSASAARRRPVVGGRRARSVGTWCWRLRLPLLRRRGYGPPPVVYLGQGGHLPAPLDVPAAAGRAADRMVRRPVPPDRLRVRHLGQRAVPLHGGALPSRRSSSHCERPARSRWKGAG